jgi:putative flippase GtrA
VVCTGGEFMADGEFGQSVDPACFGPRAGRVPAILFEVTRNRLVEVIASGAHVPIVRIFRFGVVGTVNTGLYFGLYAALRPVCSYLVAHALAFLTAMVVSFFLHCSITFRTRPTLRKFLLFPLSNVTGFAVQTAGLSVFVNLAGMNPAYAPLPAMAAAVPVTFLVARLVLLESRATRRHRGVTRVAATGA